MGGFIKLFHSREATLLVWPFFHWRMGGFIKLSRSREATLLIWPFFSSKNGWPY
jgi:hypothetical protein